MPNHFPASLQPSFRWMIILYSMLSNVTESALLHYICLKQIHVPVTRSCDQIANFRITFETKKFPIPSSAIDIFVYKASCITLHRIFFLHICPLPNCIQKSRLISIPRRHLRIQMLNNLLSVLWQDSADRNQIIWVTSEENAVIYL